MSDTPRTNAIQQGIDRRANLRGFVVPEDVFDMADLARQLEADLAAANAKLAALQVAPPADVSGSEWSELRALLDVAHEHVEGRSECAICDESLVSAAIREIKKHRAILQASPDVAGLVERVNIRRGTDQMRKLRGERPQDDPWPWIHEKELLDALLSLSAQLAEKEAECEGLRQDAERYHGLVTGGYLDRFVDPLHPCDEEHRAEKIAARVDSYIAIAARKP